jgi:dephospho-CoA kinase
MDNKREIIAVVGMCGAGKSVVSGFLIEKGYQYLRFGQITLDKVIEKGISPTEELEKEIREGFRKEYGMGAFAVLNKPKIDKYLETGNVVVDGLYSWAEYKILKEKYGNQLIVLAVHAPPETRYSRLENRSLDKTMKNRPISRENAVKRDKAEIENIEKGGPIAMADYHLLNIGTKKELISNLEKFLTERLDLFSNLG